MNDKQNSYWVIIPALDEEASLPGVMENLKSLENSPQKILVVDNGSRDKTEIVAKQMGAIVLKEPIKGYGRACKKAIEYLKNSSEKPKSIVFMDGDGSDNPQDIEALLTPLNNGYSVVLGSRTMGNPEKGSLGFLQKWGNFLSCNILKFLYGVEFTDLGPFRSILVDLLLSLDLKDNNFGWTIELQSKLAQQSIPWKEIPVDYRKRTHGESKVSGNLRSAISAGIKIIYTIFYLYIHQKANVYQNMPWLRFIFISYLLVLGMGLGGKEDFYFLFPILTFTYILLLLPNSTKTNVDNKSQQRIDSANFYIFSGILMRLPFLFLMPSLSDDFYRTIWDGILVWERWNPYSYTPLEIISNFSSSPQEYNIFWELGPLFEKLNSKIFYSFYPPIQHMITIAGILPGKAISIVGLISINKLGFYITGITMIFLLVDLGNMLILKKMLSFREDLLKFYAWNPLVIWEGIGNLHFELILLFFVLYGYYLYRKKTSYLHAGVYFAISVGTKLLPILMYPYLILKILISPKKGSTSLFKSIAGLLLPLFFMGGIYGFLLFPHLSMQWEKGLGLYSHSFEFFSFLNRWIRISLSYWNIDYGQSGLYVWILFIILYFLLTLYGVLTWINKKRFKDYPISPEKFFFLGLCLLFLLSPVVHPWYLIPWMTLGIILGYRLVILGGWLVSISYIYYATSPYSRDSLVVNSAYVLFFLIICKEFYEYKYYRNRLRSISSSIRNFY